MGKFKNLFVLFLAATMMFAFSTPVKAEVNELISVENQEYFYTILILVCIAKPLEK